MLTTAAIPRLNAVPAPAAGYSQMHTRVDPGSMPAFIDSPHGRCVSMARHRAADEASWVKRAIQLASRRYRTAQVCSGGGDLDLEVAANRSEGPLDLTNV